MLDSSMSIAVPVLLEQETRHVKSRRAEHEKRHQQRLKPRIADEVAGVEN
jgi:hypothetical protein